MVKHNFLSANYINYEHSLFSIKNKKSFIFKFVGKFLSKSNIKGAHN